MRDTSRMKLGLLCATMLSASIVAVPAYAETADQPAAEAVDDSVIIVSGTRRDLAINKSPINISAVGAATLQEERIDDVKDLGAFVPGMTITPSGPGGAATVVVRGLTAGGPGATGSNYSNSLGTYLGDVPLYLDFKMIDIERIETLLGPQGTLYGLGTLAGSIRYIPKRPDTSSLSGEVHGRLYDVAHSSGLGYVGDVVLNIPIVSDTLAFRTATGYYYDPGFIDYPFLVKEPGVSLPQPGDVDNPTGSLQDRLDNFAPQEDVNYERTFTTRNQLGLTVPGVNAYLSYVYQQTKTEGSQSNTVGIFGEGKYENANRVIGLSNRRSHLVSLEVEADVADIFQIVSASAWTQTKNSSRGDQTNLLLDLDYDYELFPSFVAYSTGENTREQINQEIRFVSTHGGPISWVLGGFYNKMTYRADSIETLPHFAEFAANAQNPDGTWVYPRNIRDADGNIIRVENFYGGLVRPDGAEYVSFTDTETEEMAVFGEITFRPIEPWQITVGGRYFKYDTSITGGSDTPMTPAGRTRMPYPSLEIHPSRVRSGETGKDGFVWKFNTSYEFTPDLMAYATYSKGYRMGGVNRVVPCILPIDTTVQNLCALPDELAYDPDKVFNHELGVRATLFNGILNTNLSVFRVNWDGIQLGSSTTYGSIGITANGGKARSQGVDFSFSARVTPQLTIRGNYAYLDAVLKTDVPGLTDPKTGSGDVFAGDRLPGSTKNSGALSVMYTVPLDSADVALNWTSTYTGAILTEVGARGGGEMLPAYTLHRASVTYKSHDNWEVSLFANNIFDTYAVTGTGADLTRFGQVNDGLIYRGYSHAVLQPRVVGIEGRTKF